MQNTNQAIWRLANAIQNISNAQRAKEYPFAEDETQSLYLEWLQSALEDVQIAKEALESEMPF